MGFEQTAPTPVYVDNQAAETVAKDPVMNNGMKHVNRRHYFAKEAQLDGEVKFEWVDTKGNLADALTKALALPQFQAHGALASRSRARLFPVQHALLAANFEQRGLCLEPFHFGVLVPPQQIERQ